MELESGSYQFEVKNEILNGLYSMIAFGIIIFESSINDFVLLINFYLQDGKCSILRNRDCCIFSIFPI